MFCAFDTFHLCYNAVPCSNTVAIWFPSGNLQPGDCSGSFIFFDFHGIHDSFICRIGALLHWKTWNRAWSCITVPHLQYGLAEDTSRTGGSLNAKEVSPDELYSQSAIYIAAAHAWKLTYSVGASWCFSQLLYNIVSRSIFCSSSKTLSTSCCLSSKNKEAASCSS